MNFIQGILEMHSPCLTNVQTVAQRVLKIYLRPRKYLVICLEFSLKSHLESFKTLLK